MRRLLPLLLVMASCRDQPVAERRAEVEELCATYCPLRVECVADGFAGGSVDECERKCVADERPLEDSGCGEASLAALQCLASVECADLPDAISGVAGAGDTACYAELREQQDRCDLTPIY